MRIDCRSRAITGGRSGCYDPAKSWSVPDFLVPDFLVWRALVEQALDPALIEEIRAATNGGYALGNAAFAAQIAAALGRRVTRGKSGRPMKPRDDEGQERLL